MNVGFVFGFNDCFIQRQSKIKSNGKSKKHKVQSICKCVWSWELEGLLYWLVGNQYNTQNSIHPIIVQGFILWTNENKVAVSSRILNSGLKVMVYKKGLNE